MDAADNRFRLFDDVVDVVIAAGPVLVVLDDLHWADVPSLLLL
jgi:predicted ATPase